MIARFDIDSQRSPRGLALAVILGVVLFFSILHPGQAQSAHGSGSADPASFSVVRETPNPRTHGPVTNIPSLRDPVGSDGLGPVPGVTPAPSPATQASADTPKDVRLVFGFTAGTVLVLSALAFLDRRPEP